MNNPSFAARISWKKTLWGILATLTLLVFGFSQNESDETEMAHPRFWECRLEGGTFLIALSEIVTVSKHEYLVDGVGRVFETTVSSRSSVIARFYYQETIASASPLRSGQAALERAQDFAEGAAERADIEPLWKKAAKSYPRTTHAHTIEYRLEDKESVDLVFSHASTAWKRGAGSILTIREE